jgi:hypothetical protein
MDKGYSFIFEALGIGILLSPKTIPFCSAFYNTV